MPEDRSNLCVAAFERLHSADGLHFELRGDIPVAAGLGASAAAIVAGLLAAEHLYELALDRDALLAHAVELEGHPDNVAAALYGGFVICSSPGRDGRGDAPRSPEGVEAIVVVPDDEVLTEEARRAIPSEIPLEDAISNVAAASLLVLGIQRSDLSLIERGLADRIHQPRRAALYPRSMELVERAPELGAIGATISGAGAERAGVDAVAEHRQGRGGAAGAHRGVGGGAQDAVHAARRRRPGAVARLRGGGGPLRAASPALRRLDLAVLRRAPW